MVIRQNQETDEAYRRRVAEPADVVSPNALRRAANGILAPLGYSACLREIGERSFPGMFFDAGSSADVPQVPWHNYAYDMDPTMRPADRWKTLVDLVEYRGFFLIGVPPLGLGEFGFGFDADQLDLNAYDIPVPVGNFFDGWPIGAAAVYQAVYAAVDRARAAGVRFTLYQETAGCVM